MTSPSTRATSWVAAALFPAAALVIDPAGLVPTGPARWTATTVVLAVGVVVRAVARRSGDDDPRGGAGFDLAPLRGFAALVVWLGLAAAWGADPLHAWIGTPERRLGWFAWLGFGAALVLGRAVGASGVRALVVPARAAALTSIAVGAWSLADVAGWAPWGVGAGTRAGGPFGQPAFLGAAALLLGAWSLVAAVGDVGRWRWAGVAGAIAAAASVVLSQTRGALAGLVVAGLVAVARRRRGPIRRAVPLALAGVLLLVGLVVAAGAGPRLLDTFDRDRPGGIGRLDEWALAARVVADHPVLGVGPEGYRVVAPTVMGADYVRAHGVAVIPDRAHDAVLDVAAAGGVPAAVCFVVVVGLVLAAAWRLAGAASPEGAALGVGVVAAVVQSLVLFPTSEVEPWFWLTAGVVLALDRARLASTPADPDPARRAPRPRSVPATATTAVATLIALVVAVAGVQEARADRLLRRAAEAGSAPGAAELADRATELRPDSIRAWYVAGRVAARGPALTDLDRAAERFAAGLRRSPDDPALRVARGEVLVQRAVRSSLAADAARATSVLEADARRLSHHPRVLAHLAVAWDLGGRHDEARALARRARSLDPDDPVARSVARELEKP